MKKNLLVLTLFLFVIAFPLFAAEGSAGPSAEEVPADINVFHGVGAAVAIDQPEYVTDLMPPGFRPPEIKMVLVVFNYSKLPVTFDFTTSQRFDFSIYDGKGKGKEVWRWSADKKFMEVLGKVTLKPGEYVSYTAKHKFASSAGKPMPAGLYTLKGWMTASARKMVGKVSFQHKHVH